MLGVLVNTISIIVCTFIGMLFRKILNDRIEKTVMQGLGICVTFVGIIDAIKPVNGTAGILVVILSFAIGGMIGSALNIEKGFENLGSTLERLVIKDKSANNSNKFAEGFTQATMVFCIGAMVIYGSISAGLGDNKTLYVKSVLDGVVSMLLAVKFGVGVAFSAIPVFLIQGIIALSSGFIGEFLLASPLFMQELTAIGGVFVTMIGINLLEIKKMHVENMLPAILGACYFLF